jgi:hypothetical protein
MGISLGPAGLPGQVSQLVAPRPQCLPTERRPDEGEAPFARQAVGGDNQRRTLPPDLVEAFHIHLTHGLIADHPEVPTGRLDPEQSSRTLLEGGPRRSGLGGLVGLVGLVVTVGPGVLRHLFSGQCHGRIFRRQPAGSDRLQDGMLHVVHP